jgi:hypothetical protein
VEISKEVLRTIESDEIYKEIFASYKKLDNFIKKDPVKNFINIKKQAEKFLEYYEEFVKKKPTETEKIPDAKPEVKPVNVDSLNKRTVKELREICKQGGIIGYSKANKSVLIKKIKDALDSGKPKIERATQGIDLELESYSVALKKNISQWKEEFRRHFLINLENLLKEKKFELKGTLPMLKTWLFLFKIDFEKQDVPIWYGPEQESVVNCKLDYNILAETLDKYCNRIINRELDESDFLKKLYRAYEISIFKEEKIKGDQVPIIELLLDYISLIQNNRYKVNPRKEFYTDYPRYLFSYDLYRLKKRRYQNYELTPIIATRAYTKKQADYIWIPTNEKGDGNYISHIKFREIKNE